MINERKHWKGKLQRHTLPLDISAVTVLKRGWEGSICPISATAGMGKRKKENKRMAHGTSSIPFFSWPCLLPRRTATPASSTAAAILKPWKDSVLRPRMSEGESAPKEGSSHAGACSTQPPASLALGSPSQALLPSPFPALLPDPLCLHHARVFPLCTMQNAGLGAQQWGIAVWYCTAWSFLERQLKGQTLRWTPPSTHRTSHLLVNTLHHSKSLAVSRVRLQTTYPDRPFPPAWHSPCRYISRSCYVSCFQVDNGLASEK